MPQFEPILLVSSQAADHRNKGGGGDSGPPLVPVTQQLRTTLSTQIDQALTQVGTLSLELTEGNLPFVARLRDQALAKSNRPTGMLVSVGLGVDATESPGELISRASVAEVLELRRRINTAQTQRDIYAVSTFDSFRFWDPITDALGVATLREGSELFDHAYRSGLSIRLEFFPWLRMDSRIGVDETFASILMSLGFRPIAENSSGRRQAMYFELDDEVDIGRFSELFGIRGAGITPQYAALESIDRQAIEIIGPVPALPLDPKPDLDSVVGVLDSGIDCELLLPYIAGRLTFDPLEEVDSSHGTFVGGLVSVARRLNDDDPRFPAVGAKVVDAQVLPRGDVPEFLLIERIRDAVKRFKAEGVRVWNCSFAARHELTPVRYSTLAEEMDEICREYGVLFVQAIGNYNAHPRRRWPPTEKLRDGLCSPAEAVESIAVGSLAHKDGWGPAGTPASYTRRGPSFGGQNKPDVCYWSGDYDASGVLGDGGVKSLQGPALLAHGVGTSFAAPLVSCIAANLWSDLESVGPHAPEPTLVKALVVHSASLSRDLPIDGNRVYFGAGVPDPQMSVLFDSSHSFTTVHRAELSAGVNWWKDPFPMPDCLISPDGKFQGEVFVTVAYSPLIDSAHGSECVRTSIEASFGFMSLSAKGTRILNGVAPSEKMGARWESQRVEEGKWSPLKTHYRRVPQGIQIANEWALKLTMTERVDGELEAPQPVYAIVTLRALDENLPVYAEGLVALRAQQHQWTPLGVRSRLRVGT